jgi:hypothetical protein
MNTPIKSESITAASALAGRVSLVTGSTSGISDAAVSITGRALPVDGGWTAH